MMRTLVFGLLAAMMPAHAEIITSDDAVIDTDYAIVEKAIDKARESECKKVPVVKRLDCFTRVERPYRIDGRIRGTPEYLAKHFINKSDEDITRAIEAIETQLQNAKDADLYSSDEIQPGELTQFKLKYEINQLIYLRDHDPDRHCVISLDEKQKAFIESREPECE
ncbi:hypothetical protein ACFQE2_05270 [Methylophaga thalassica]|nr:hypothetical protein [Methylophaga thalassica]